MALNKKLLLPREESLDLQAKVILRSANLRHVRSSRLGTDCCVRGKVMTIPNRLSLTLSVPLVLLNSPNLSPYFSLNKFKRILLLIFSSLLCLSNSHFFITKCLILYVLCNEKLGVDNWLGLNGLKKFVLKGLHTRRTKNFYLLRISLVLSTLQC